MSSWLDTIDPDVRQVLEDVTRDRRSKLFRLDRSHEAQTPLANIETVSPRAAGWRPAERHLLETYREEVWLLVHAACVRKISLDERATSIGPVDWKRFPGQRLSDEQIGLRASSLGTSRPRGTIHLQSTGLLEQLAQGFDVSAINYDSFGVAARQILDSDSTRLLAASIDNLQGRSSAARELAGPVARESLRADITFPAWSILGYAQSQLGDNREAADSFERAFELSPTDFTMAANAVLAAIQAGHSGLALEVGPQLDLLAEGHESAVVELCSHYSLRRRDRGTPNRSDPNVLRRASEALGSSSRVILDEVFR